MSKKIAFKNLGIVVPAQTATMGPPIATTLGSKLQVNVFVKQVNDATKGFDKGSPVRVILNIFADRTFEMKLLGNTTRYKIFKAAGVTQGAKKAGHEIQGRISQADLRRIAEEQRSSMGNPGLLQAMKCVEATARSAGILVD